VQQLPPYQAKILPDWIDYNGHLRDAYYGLIASYAVDAVMDHLGLDAAYRETTQGTLYSLEMHIHFLHEVKSTDDLKVMTSVLDFDRKRIHAGLKFSCSRLAEPVAMADMMLLHVRQGDKPAAAPFPESVLNQLGELKLSASDADAFGPLSRKIELKRR
jgi:acyl-CoA thioesterase FadM